MTLRGPRPNHARLLENPDIRRWHANVAQGSRITADVYLRRLGAFCLRTGIAPDALPKKKEADLHALLLDFIDEETKRRKTGSFIHSTVKAVRSWLGHHGVRVNRPLKIAGSNATPTLAEERVPTQEELRKIFLAAYLKERVCCVLMAHSGLRPEVLGNYAGNDGLRLRDFPELEIGKKNVEFKRVPTTVAIRPELSKARHKYLTFLGSEGCGYVRDYLEERLRAGEDLGPGSDLISPTGWKKDFITTVKVSTGLRNAIRSAGFHWRPYILRAYFDTQLLLAESKGKVAHDYRVFWMGHKGSMEARYTTNKGRLPQHFIEDMREAYERCEPFLSTTPVESSADVPKEVARAMLQLAGYKDAEIEKLDLSDLAKVRDMVRDRLAASAVPHQEVVSIEEIPGRLAQGWQFVAAVGGSKAVLTAPATVGTSPTPGASAQDPNGTVAQVPPPSPASADGPGEGVRQAASDEQGPLPPRALARRAHALWEENAARRAAASSPEAPTGPQR